LPTTAAEQPRFCQPGLQQHAALLVPKSRFAISSKRAQRAEQVYELLLMFALTAPAVAATGMWT
jgi:hypothetical protein